MRRAGRSVRLKALAQGVVDVAFALAAQFGVLPVFSLVVTLPRPPGRGAVFFSRSLLRGAALCRRFHRWSRV